MCPGTGKPPIRINPDTKSGECPVCGKRFDQSRMPLWPLDPANPGRVIPYHTR